MADQEQGGSGSLWDEYEKFTDELQAHLELSGEGYDVQLPLTQLLGLAWDVRIQVAYLPAPRSSVSWVHEFFLVSLSREGKPYFLKRCDSPYEVVTVVHELAAGDLTEVPLLPGARLDEPDSARKYPEWSWCAAEGKVPGRDRIGATSKSLRFFMGEYSGA